MKFYIMDRSGHTTLEFTAEQKAEAMAKFEALIKEGKTAATRNTGSSEYTAIKDPNKIQDETLFITQKQAG